jgi:hypothetical protein
MTRIIFNALHCVLDTHRGAGRNPSTKWHDMVTVMSNFKMIVIITELKNKLFKRCFHTPHLHGIIKSGKIILQLFYKTEN